MPQSELQLDLGAQFGWNKLIKQLTALGYESIQIPDEKSLEK
jgi:hypothetical protein